MTAAIVLASGSASRRAVLEAAGLSITIDKPDVDETALKADCHGRGLDAGKTAEMLAVAKAAQVSPRHPGRIVIGGDQMLDCEGTWFDKPADMAAAGLQLAQLSGKTHTLSSAIVAMRDGSVVWRTVETADLTMRPLSRDFILSYLDRAGGKVLSSVGAYQVEGLGIQLFTNIRGDHFTILGMPLLSLLGFLRAEGLVGE